MRNLIKTINTNCPVGSYSLQKYSVVLHRCSIAFYFCEQLNDYLQNNCIPTYLMPLALSHFADISIVTSGNWNDYLLQM